MRGNQERGKKGEQIGGEKGKGKRREGRGETRGGKGGSRNNSQYLETKQRGKKTKNVEKSL